MDLRSITSRLLPSHFADEEAVRPVAVGPQGHASTLDQSDGPRQCKGFCLVSLVLCQKGLNHLSVLPVQQGTGGVHQRPARLDISGGVAQDVQLHGGQVGQGGRVLIADVRLFADDAETRAGYVADDRVKAPRPFLAENAPVGAGGLDVAVAMGGGAYYLAMPKVCRVNLTGKLSPWVTAKDVILEVLRRLSVKGGVGKVMEYAGEGVKTLSVPQRATITNMGAELGATTSVFPSDEVTKRFLDAQGRGEDWIELSADADATYDEEVTIALDEIAPLVACPHSPDNIKQVKDVAGLKVDQVAIGSCTNSSYTDMMTVAALLKGKSVHPDVSLVIAPGSKQVMNMLAANGALADIISAGARILECGCGPCIGMGQAPATNAVSLRTINRNFEGRSGTKSAQVYIVSPETAVASALAGVVTDPHTLGEAPLVSMPEHFMVNDNLIIPPAPEGECVKVVRGPNIQPFPKNTKVPKEIKGGALIKVEDNITTDHIMPSNAKLLPFRSNVPYLADYCLTPCDPEFPARAKAAGGGFIIAGQNYGQGSSREHAALAPLQLGVKGVIAKSFARIHMANLINNGILPLVFVNEWDYDNIRLGDEFVIKYAADQIKGAVEGQNVMVTLVRTGEEIPTRLNISARQCGCCSSEARCRGNRRCH